MDAVLLFRAMLVIVSTWCVLGLVFIGIGLLFWRVHGAEIHDAENLLACFWLGWALTLAFLQIYHFLFPVGLMALVIVTVAGLAGMVLYFRRLRLFVLNLNAHEVVIPAICFIFAAFLIADHAILPPSGPDAGAYHISSILWASHHPLIPGLGNLYGPFAYNCSFFLYAALLDVGIPPLSHGAWHFANGLLVLILFGQIILSANRVFKIEGSARLGDYFFLLLIPPALRGAVSGYVANPSPDLSLFVLGFMISGYTLFLLETKRGHREDLWQNLLLINVLACAGITIKLSFAAFALTAILVADMIWCIKPSWGGGKRLPLFRILFFACLIIIPWMARSVIMSGYIAYPLTFVSFPVEWRVPLASARNVRDVVRAWTHARQLRWDEVISSRQWLGQWIARLKQQVFDAIFPLGQFVAALFFLIIAKLKVEKARAVSPATYLVFLPPAAGIYFWFLTLPEPRFTGGAFWILAASGFAMVAGFYKPDFRKALCAAVSLSGVLFFISPWAMGKEPPIFITSPGKDNGFYGKPETKIKEFVTGHNLVLYVPAEKAGCWEPVFPWTPSPHKNLRLRRQGDIRSGFVVDPFDDDDPTVGFIAPGDH